MCKQVYKCKTCDDFISVHTKSTKNDICGDCSRKYTARGAIASYINICLSCYRVEEVNTLHKTKTKRCTKCRGNLNSSSKRRKVKKYSKIGYDGRNKVILSEKTKKFFDKDKEKKMIEDYLKNNKVTIIQTSEPSHVANSCLLRCV